MKKFEEEIKRPSNAGIDPFSKRDVSFEKLSSKFTKGAQTLKEWKEYAFKAEDRIRELESQLEKQQPEIPEFVAEYARDCERELSCVLEEIYMDTDYLEDHSTRNEREGLIARYWLYNRTFAKEKRFYLKDSRELESVGNTCIGFVTLYLKNDGYLTTDKTRAGKFTQQEIGSMETGSYEQIKVEEKQ